MDCNRCKHRDDESREIDECYNKLYQIAMNGLMRGDKELANHVLFEIESLHKSIKGHIRIYDGKKNGEQDVPI